MFRKNKDQSQQERLDRLGRAVVRAAALSEGEVEGIASSPFLYTRLRARIEAARQQQAESSDWLAVLSIAWRAVPAMGLAAALAVGAFLLSAIPTAGDPFGDEPLLAATEPSEEGGIFAPPSSRDEVLSTLLGADERSNQR